MIAKNKNCPATVYLLGSNNMNKFEQEGKSARLTFNKKKSSRSISQYQKWGISKDVGNGLFQSSSRTSSEIKKIVLNKNQFGLQSLTLERRLNLIVQLFGNKKEQKRREQVIQNEKRLKKSSNRKSGDQSILSTKDFNENRRQKSLNQKDRSHIKTEIILNGSMYEKDVEMVITKIQRKFEEYEKLSEDWKLRYRVDQNNLLLDDMVKMFKNLFNEALMNFCNEIQCNLEFFQKSLTDVAKQYQIEIQKLHKQVSKKGKLKQIIQNMCKIMVQKHKKGMICTRIFEEIGKREGDLQQLIKRGSCYEEIVSLDNKRSQINEILGKKWLIYQQMKQIKEIRQMKQIREIRKQRQRLECDGEQNSQRWQDNFQSRESIKGVLKYINNYNKKHQSKELKGKNYQLKEYKIQNMNKINKVLDNVWTDEFQQNSKNYEQGVKANMEKKIRRNNLKIMSQR